MVSSIAALTSLGGINMQLATVGWHSITDRKRGLTRSVFGKDHVYLLHAFRTGHHREEPSAWWYWEVKLQSDPGHLIAEGCFKRLRDSKIAAVRAAIEYDEARRRPT